MLAKPFSMLLSFCLLLFLSLTGCSRPTHQNAPTGRGEIKSVGRSGQSPASGLDNSAPAHSAPSVKDNRPVVVAFGDSLTAGHGTVAGDSYPDYLQRDLNALGYRYRVVNEGISGNTTKDGVDRLPEILALHPEIAIVAFGGNDGLRGIPISDTETNLNTIISTLQDAHAKIILGGITLPPNYGHTYISKFDAIYRKASKKYSVPLLPFMLKGAYGVPGDIQSDGIHPTAKGNVQVAKNFLPLLLPMLKKTVGSNTEPEKAPK